MSESAQHLSPQDAFARHWFPDGYPLWNPTPVLLPPLRQTEGIKIGDIGVVDRDGCFDAVFNICDPRDCALEHEYGFPPGFARIRQPRIINYNSFRPGYVFSSPETPWFSRSVDMPYFTDERTMVSGRVGTHHTANLLEDGACIVVPQGAESFKVALKCHRLFESEANDHWSTWFNFATQQLGSLRSLYLITGVYRTQSWALASFKRDGQQVEVTCELVEEDGKLQADNSQWTPLGRFASKIGPSTESQGHDNQTIFIQSFTITPNGTVRHPNREQLASPEEFSVTESGEFIERENTQTSRQAETAWPMPGSWFRGGVATFSTTFTHADSAAIQHVPETTQPVHPSEIVNRYLLTKHPSAEVAVTHDSTWITMLARGQLSKLEDLESTIDAIVSKHYKIVSRNGAVSLRNKDVSLARFGVHPSDLPVDLTDCIQKDGKTSVKWSFGTVYSGNLRITDASVVKVAIKVIVTEGMNDHGLSEKEMEAQRMAEEFASLDHINVLPLIWASVEPGQLMMTFPWTERTLTSYIDAVHNKLTDVQILTLVHDVAAGLHYLHSNGIIHGCVSGATVVVDAKGTALLADYGLSTLVDIYGTSSRRLELQHARWAAPESLLGGRGALTEKNDIYSFGGIMFQVLSGKVPCHYYELDKDVIISASMRKARRQPTRDWWRLVDDRWLFIQQCWSDSRPSSEGIVEFAKRDLDLALRRSYQDIKTAPPHTTPPLGRVSPHIATVGEEEHDTPTGNASGEIDIIFIGWAGAGESSLINMVMNTSYTTRPALQKGLRCRLWDTYFHMRPLTYRCTLLWNGTVFLTLPVDPPPPRQTLRNLTEQGVPILVWCIDAFEIMIGVYWTRFCSVYVDYCDRKVKPAVVITRGSGDEVASCAEELRALDLGLDIPIVMVRRDLSSTFSVEYKEDSKILRELLFELILR